MTYLAYIIVILLALIDIHIYFISPFLEIRRKRLKQERRLNSRRKIPYENGFLIIEEYPKKCLIGLENITDLKIDIPFIRLEKLVVLNKVTISNVKKIVSFNVLASEIEFENCRYVASEDAIYLNKRLVFFYKKQTKLSLIKHAREDDISKKTLKYFSNAPYVQFASTDEEIRISKPYYDKNEKTYLITPSKVNGLYIRQISLNMGEIDFLYIPTKIKKIILEKEVIFHNVIIDSKKYKERFGGIVNRKTNKYLHFNNKILRKCDAKLASITYKPYYQFVRFKIKEATPFSFEKYLWE